MSITILTPGGAYTSPLRKVESIPLYHFAWDDEDPDLNNMSRTMQPDWTGVDNPPAVIRYYPSPEQDEGEFRVNIFAWWDFVVWLNGGGKIGEQAANYWSGDSLAQFNRTGWPMFMNVGMRGNLINVLEIAGDWVKFETLKVMDLARAQGMTFKTHPHLIHSFHCVTWDRETKTTKRIYSTGTNRGEVYYPSITELGYAWIRRRYVIAGKG